MNADSFLQLNNDLMTVVLTDVGAAVVSIIIKDRDGIPRDIVLGYDGDAGYLRNATYFGAVVGRCVNQIVPPDFVWGDKEVHLSRDADGNHLHGGDDCIAFRRWQIVDERQDSICFKTVSQDGEEGYPGNVIFYARYTLSDLSLRLELFAESDESTPINLSAHPYFNLSGHDGGDISEHVLQINANECCVSNLTGKIDEQKEKCLDNQNYNFLLKREVGQTDYDCCYFLDKDCEYAAELYSPETGICLRLHCTQPCLQLYTADEIECESGKDGVTYHGKQAVCLEPQYYPNFVNTEDCEPGFADKNHMYRQNVLYEFSVK